MQVLGLHGVYPRSHDSSACLVSNEVVTAFVEEERFTRSKKAFDHPPHQSIDWCLDSTNTSVNDLSAITYGWQGGELSLEDVLPKSQVERLDKEIPVVQIPHHEAHAASTFYTSPFQEAAILIVDGQGEQESTTIWRGDREEGLQKLESLGVEKSLGYFYGAVARFCGLGSFGAGKLMGLAPYGQPVYTDLLREIYSNVTLPEQTGFDSQDAYFDYFLDQLYAHGLPPIQMTETIDLATLKTRSAPVLTELHQNIAASAQVVLEAELAQLAKRATLLADSRFLCMAGGVAMNCVSNSLIQNSNAVDELFVQPACEDSGVSMGSALAYVKRPARLESPYLGPAFDDEVIAAELERLGIQSSAHHDISSKTAQLLAAGKIVGWFQGGLEFGPRALGHRSILANPSTHEMHRRVNAVKSRESWRPFGPSVLADAAPDLFEQFHESDFMLRSFIVREKWKDRLAAVVHVDGSTRPQTVERETNPRYHKLITEFSRLTGIPAILNTSFNDHDEPIVATPRDAIKTFYSTGLDALAIGNRLIEK